MCSRCRERPRYEAALATAKGLRLDDPARAPSAFGIPRHHGCSSIAEAVELTAAVQAKYDSIGVRVACIRQLEAALVSFYKRDIDAALEVGGCAFGCLHHRRACRYPLVQNPCPDTPFFAAWFFPWLAACMTRDWPWWSPRCMSLTPTAVRTHTCLWVCCCIAYLSQVAKELEAVWGDVIPPALRQHCNDVRDGALWVNRPLPCVLRLAWVGCC